MIIHKTILSFRPIMLFCFLGFFFLQKGYAQRPRFYPQTHEIGVRIANIQTAPSLSEFEPSDGKSIDFANGIQYKFHWDLFHVFRLSLGRQESTYETTNPVSDPDMFRAKVEHTNFALGYEGNLPLGSMTLFAGAEGVYSRQSLILSTVFSGTNETFWQETQDSGNWGANVFGGMRIFLTQHVSTTLEAYATYLDQNPDSEQFIHDLYREVTSNNWNVGLNLYLNVHFVKLKKRCACGG